jgi:hypothetical protein
MHGDVYMYGKNAAAKSNLIGKRRFLILCRKMTFSNVLKVFNKNNNL